MLRIAMLLFSVIATTMAGSGIVAALTLGYDRLTPLLAAASLGLVAALPVTLIVARRIANRG